MRNAYAQSQCSFSRCGDAGLSICGRVRPRSASRHHRVSLIETTLLANSLSLVGRTKCFDALFSPLQFSRSAALHLPQPQRLSPSPMEFVGRQNCARRRPNPIARPLIPSHACCWDDEEGRVGSRASISVRSPDVCLPPDIGGTADTRQPPLGAEPDSCAATNGLPFSHRAARAGSACTTVRQRASSVLRLITS